MHNVTLSAYFPFYDDPKNFLDMRGKKLRTVQSFIRGTSAYITVGMDPDLHISYRTAACIPELNHIFGHQLKLSVRDIGVDMDGYGQSRIDICVDNEEVASDDFWDRTVTVIL